MNDHRTAPRATAVAAPAPITIQPLPVRQVLPWLLLAMLHYVLLLLRLLVVVIVRHRYRHRCRHRRCRRVCLCCRRSVDGV